MTKDWKDFLREERTGRREQVAILPGGEAVERRGRSLMVCFPDDKRMVLLSANFNGGLFEGPEAIVNTTGLTEEDGKYAAERILLDVLYERGVKEPYVEKDGCIIPNAVWTLSQMAAERYKQMSVASQDTSPPAEGPRRRTLQQEVF
jgi:hypothetical protein